MALASQAHTVVVAWDLHGASWASTARAFKWASCTPTRGAEAMRRDVPGKKPKQVSLLSSPPCSLQPISPLAGYREEGFFVPINKREDQAPK